MVFREAFREAYLAEFREAFREEYQEVSREAYRRFPLCLQHRQYLPFPEFPRFRLSQRCLLFPAGTSVCAAQERGSII